ncbi:MAG TPA: GNAT family N-acetyltransferase [Bacteroidia bacterium]|nr:GNAT family N-acetyltransferase [Bacteroidia bacterium]
MRVHEPVTPEDFQNYYRLRWEILRRPWNQAEGSEKDNAEETSFHAMITDDETGECLAVGRLQKNSGSEGQVRFFAVKTEKQGKGLGKMLMSFLEQKAKQLGIETVILQARENAVPFYLASGYTIREKTFLLFDEIQHYLMEKKI